MKYYFKKYFISFSYYYPKCTMITPDTAVIPLHPALNFIEVTAILFL